jgi:hypothetical protein
MDSTLERFHAAVCVRCVCVCEGSMTQPSTTMWIIIQLQSNSIFPTNPPPCCVEKMGSWTYQMPYELCQYHTHQCSV